jgi:hypothetical protein
LIPPDVRIFVCTEAVDMRSGFDRLTQVARGKIGHDPVQGGVSLTPAARGARSAFANTYFQWLNVPGLIPTSAANSFVLRPLSRHR